MRKQKVIADEQAKAANDNWTRAEWRIYADNISLSQLAWERQSPELAYRYLNQCRPEFRGWEHDYLYTLFNQNPANSSGPHVRVASVTYSPDGKRIASGGIGDKTVKVWDADTGAELLALTEHSDGTSRAAPRLSASTPSPSCRRFRRWRFLAVRAVRLESDANSNPEEFVGSD